MRGSFLTYKWLYVAICLALALIGLAQLIERPSTEQEADDLATAPEFEATLAEQCTVVFTHNRKGCVFAPKAPFGGLLNGVGPGQSHGRPSDAVIAGGAGEGGKKEGPPSRLLLTEEEEAGRGEIHLRGSVATTLREDEADKGAAAEFVGGGNGNDTRRGIGGTPDPIYGPPMKTMWQNHIEITASEALDLQPLLDCRPVGYGGADVAASIKAPPFKGDKKQSHAMWILGDTFLGRTQGRRRLPGFFVHNSVATVPIWAKPSNEADPSAVRFWYNVSTKGGGGGGGGCPSSLFRIEKEGDNECHEGGEYLWPISGLGVDLKQDKSHPKTDLSTSKLILLAVRWAYLPWIEEDVDLKRSVFNFHVLGTTLIVVDNADEKPPKWRYRTKNLPGTGPQDNWSSAITLIKPDQDLATSKDDLVYLLGSRQAPMEVGRQILGRVSVGSLLDLSLDGMEVWGLEMKGEGEGREEGNQQGEGGKVVAVEESKWGKLETYLAGGWNPATLTSPVYTGTSLHYSPYLQAWYSIAIDWFTKRALLHTAKEITGPWESVSVYDIPSPFNGSTLMAYTGKAHPELGQVDEIIFTYVANTPGIVYPLFEEGADVLYVPRFVRLSLKKVKGGESEGEQASLPSAAEGEQQQQQQQQPISSQEQQHSRPHQQQEERVAGQSAAAQEVLAAAGGREEGEGEVTGEPAKKKKEGAGQGLNEEEGKGKGGESDQPKVEGGKRGGKLKVEGEGSVFSQPQHSLHV